MNDKEKKQIDSIMRMANLIEKQAGRAVRPIRSDGYVNLLNRYGTTKDTTEHYQFEAEPSVPDEALIEFYEGNGLFAKIIDTPAEESIKHGFELEGIKDQEVEDFCREALDELDWEETAMTAIKWARLFGGSIAVLLVNDGKGLEEPLDWSNICSIDDIRVYDRSLIQPDYQSMYQYDPDDPFRTRGSRLGMPEYYFITSRYGNFTVHESRCLVFQNGILPENSTNSVYQLWGMPEYIRIKRAIRDVELSHSCAPKMLDKSVQAIYKMKDLASELATEEGEGKVLKRLQTIDMARGLMNSITIDSEGEDYDFRTFQFNGVSEIIDTSCNYLSALTSIPQTILFGRSPAGMNATGDSDFENYYNFVERIQKRMLRSNLRYLLSIIFQAGIATGEIEEMPKIKVRFNPLWSMSELEQADLELKKAQTQQTKAQTTQTYVDMQVIDPSEVRKKLSETDEYDVEEVVPPEDEDLFSDEVMKQFLDDPYAPLTSEEGNSPDAAPAATKLPQDMTNEEIAQSEDFELREQESGEVINNPIENEKTFSVGVLVISDGKVLTGTRHNDFGYGLICGPGGHGELGETPEQAAFRETEEEFGISPKELIPLGQGPVEEDTGLAPHIFLCTDYEGKPDNLDLEMTDIQFRTLEEIAEMTDMLFQPFADSLDLLKECIGIETFTKDSRPLEDGGAGSRNHGHKGVPGKIGGSAPKGCSASAKSYEKHTKTKEALKKASPSKKADFLSKTGVIPKNEIDDLKKKVANGDEDAIKKLDEYEEQYTDMAEYGAEPKNIEVEMRDNLKNMSEDDMMEWIENAAYESIPDSLNDDSVAQRISYQMGMCETPQVVCKEEFDDFVKQNKAEVIYRGVEATNEISAEQMQRQMLYDTEGTYYGGGIYGDGLYFSTSKETADCYGETGTVTKCALRPDAKVYKYDNADRNAWEEVGGETADVYALVKGYDAIRVNKGSEDYLVILNRAALVAEDPMESQMDSLINGNGE